MLNRNRALALLQKYNQEAFHIRHALTVEALMRWFAERQGYAEEADFWGLVGLLHDIDFERFPEQHCEKAPELLAEIDAPQRLVDAIRSHAYGHVAGLPEPLHPMEKILFAADELTGIVFAASLMRPSRSVQDMALKSLKKKFRDRSFAAGCSRDTIREGAERLGWDLDQLMEETLAAMRASEDQVNREWQRLTGDSQPAD